jgi:hypothetical protein
VLGDEGRDCVMIEADRAIVPLTPAHARATKTLHHFEIAPGNTPRLTKHISGKRK